MKSKIDILICSYNEAPQIPHLLESLRAQTVAKDKFRIIFVDNASTDNTREVVRQAAYDLDLLYVYEGHLGKNWACNKGYEYVLTDYVAHLDADCIANSKWLERIFSVIEQEKPDLLGGPYIPYYTVTKPRWFLDSYYSFALGNQPRYIMSDEYLNGSNMVWRRSVIERLKGFKTDIGMKGRGFERGDETELIVRARREIPNFRVFYDPGILVSCLVRPEALSMSYWVRRSFYQARTLHEIVGMPRNAWGIVPRILGNLILIAVRLFPGLALRDRTRYPYPQNYVFECVLPRLRSLGYLCGCLEHLFQKS
ncbi:MAG: glycosyltransferase [candidate division KSB1 bacterium]|nr:glycosyltransferase [candidate division KSB1 bacterium]